MFRILSFLIILILDDWKIFVYKTAQPNPGEIYFSK